MVLRVRVILLVDTTSLVVVDETGGYEEVAGGVGWVEEVLLDGDVG